MGLPTIQPYPLPTSTELSKPRGPWQPETDRVALLVHDMQRYFLRPYAMDASPIAEVIKNIASLIAHARAKKIPVFYTAQKGNQDPVARGLQGDLWGPGMQATPEHESIVEPLTPAKGDRVLLKHRYSAFQRSEFAELLQDAGRDQLIVTGVYAHIGCLATTVEAFQRDVEPFMVADAVADFSYQQHTQALQWIAGCCGVPVFTRELIECLS